MNNLITRNPILRFKLGLKILKFLWGSFILPNALRFIYETEAERPLYETGQWTDPKTGNTYWIGSDRSMTLIKGNLKPSSTPVRRRVSSNLYYVSGFQDKMNSTLKSRNDVKAFLLNLINLGYNVGKSGADGIWGKDTQAAYDKFRADLQNKKINEAKQNLPTLADTMYNASKDNQIYPFAGRKLPEPNFGYYSNGTYQLDNPKWMKKEGIKNFNSLQDYVNLNPNSNLALDLLHYYGGDLSKLEKDAGISGHYGRKDRKRLNNFLAGMSQGFRDGYMDRVREYDLVNGTYKTGGRLIPRAKEGMSFGQAFKKARKLGLKEFTWNGKRYHTRTKEEEETNKKSSILPKKDVLDRKVKADFAKISKEVDDKYKVKNHPNDSTIDYTFTKDGKRYAHTKDGKNIKVVS